MRECRYPARECDDCSIFVAHQQEVADRVSQECLKGEPFSEPEIPDECLEEFPPLHEEWPKWREIMDLQESPRGWT